LHVFSWNCIHMKNLSSFLACFQLKLRRALCVTCAHAFSFSYTWTWEHLNTSLVYAPGDMSTIMSDYYHARSTSTYTHAFWFSYTWTWEHSNTSLMYSSGIMSTIMSEYYHDRSTYRHAHTNLSNAKPGGTAHTHTYTTHTHTCVCVYDNGTQCCTSLEWVRTIV
jgi:hypothetical protein